MTNFERIKEMSVEELAELLNGLKTEHDENGCPFPFECLDITCRKCFIKWLNFQNNH